MNFYFTIFFLCVLIFQKVFGQSVDTLLIRKDSVYLTLEETENLFLQNNYQLLAERYNVDIAKAGIVQARLWLNPTFFFEHVLYNPNDKKVLDRTKNNEEIMVQLQQIVSLVGKRSKLVRLAETNAALEQLAFQDLLRNLRFQLSSDFAQIFYGLKTLSILKIEEAQLRQLIAASRLQLSQGAISGYELTRIQYELQSLRQDIKDQIGDISDNEKELKMMLRMDAAKFIVPKFIPLPDTSVVPAAIALDSAIKNRPDYKGAVTQLLYQNQSLKVERANAVPNVTFGGTYDRLGNAFPNYFGVNMQMDLPILNRNQGNIRIAELGVEAAKKGIDNSGLQLQQEVLAAYDQVVVNTNIYNNIGADYRNSLRNISTEAIKNYQRRTIGLLDFIDKIRTYKDGIQGVMDSEMNYFISKQYFDFVTNSTFYR